MHYQGRVRGEAGRCHFRWGLRGRRCPGDYEEARKVKGNAALCFKENMDRFVKAKIDYEDTAAALEENGSDLDIVKAHETAKANLQKYTNKMVMYLSKAKVAADRATELKPAPAPKAEEAEEASEAAAE